MLAPRNIAATLFVLLLAVSVTLVAQEPAEPVIHFKQRLLKLNTGSIHDEPAKTDSIRILRLMIAGNIYQTERHAAYAWDARRNRYNFRDELKYIQPVISLGDVTIANLKTSFANDVTSAHSTPDEFALALKYSGLNTLVHANAHVARIDKKTLKRTRDLLYDFDMLHTGAFTDNMQRNGNYPLIINRKGFRIALLNYTIPALRPSISRDIIINEAEKIYIERDMRAAKVNKPDFIIVYFDWGTMNNETPSHKQMELARYCLEQGADLIVGTQPNLPMRLDYVNYYSGGQVKEGIVAYSMGNLIASNEEVKNRNGFIIDMELKKNNYTGTTSIGDWGVIPVYTHYDTGSAGQTAVYSVPCSGVEAGAILPGLPYIEKRRVINGAYEVRKLLGDAADEIQYNVSEVVAGNVMETIDLIHSSFNNRFSPRKASDIPPTPAPVLPLYADSSNNPPSLAAIYDPPAPQPTAAGNSTSKTSAPPANENRTAAYNREKQKAEQIFSENQPASAKNTATETAKSPTKKPQETVVQINPNNTVQTTNITATNNTPLQLENIKLTEKSAVMQTDTVYRIQIYALNKFIPLDTNYYTHLKGYDVVEEDGYFKYLLGNYKSYSECENYWKTQIQPRYKSSFVVPYVRGKRKFE